jgi:uncharacterized protein YndB with AHSA1/START domain
MADNELRWTRGVRGEPSDVFYAFSTAQGWRDWLCDSARMTPRPGGSYQLSWNRGWYAAGVILDFRRPEKIALTWQGHSDPAATEVVIGLQGNQGTTEVELRHRGFGEGAEWRKIRAEVERGWELGLENLVSIFDTGEDLRITRRPMLGIMGNDFDEEIAGQLGVPVAQGVRIDRAVEGMGAQRAGLQSNDVVVEMDGVPIRGWGEIGSVLQRHRGGDVIPVTFYRGSEKRTLPMELSRRPIEPVELEPPAMAGRLRKIQAELAQEARAAFAGVSEHEAEVEPSPGEWTAKENLAHLIAGELGTADSITELIGDGEREFPEDGTNIRERLQAILAVTPTIPALLDRYELAQREAAAVLERADKLKARPGVLWRVGQNLFQLAGTHERGHLAAVRAAVEAARRK